jgi:hypothetical protein
LRASIWSWVSSLIMPGCSISPPKKMCRRLWAVTSMTRGVRGSFCSSRLSDSAALLAWVTQLISVPPETTWTQNVSGRRASALAIGSTESGALRIRTYQRTWPTR